MTLLVSSAHTSRDLSTSLLLSPQRVEDCRENLILGTIVLLACPRKQEILHAFISFLLFLAEEAALLQFRNAIGHLRRTQSVSDHRFFPPPCASVGLARREKRAMEVGQRIEDCRENLIK
jgi:hypothetical protein